MVYCVVNSKNLNEFFGTDKGKKLNKVFKRYYPLSRTGLTHEQIDKLLDKSNNILKGYGVEPLNGEYTFTDNYYRNTIGLYVNLGDTYITTILYDTDKQKFLITSWGDWYEYTKEYKEQQKNNY